MAADASGGGTVGVIGAGVTLGVPGSAATAFRFDGSGASSVRIQYGSGALAPNINRISLSAWVNPSSFSCGQCAVASN